MFLSDKMSNKNSSFLNINNHNSIQKQKSSDFSTKTETNNRKNNSNYNIQKIENPLDFIRQKKKFTLYNYFDKKGTKDFLESKEQAMMEIKLDEDEVIINNSNKYNKKKINPAISLKDKKLNINKVMKRSKSKNRRSAEFLSSLQSEIEPINYRTDLGKSSIKKLKKKMVEKKK